MYMFFREREREREREIFPKLLTKSKVRDSSQILCRKEMSMPFIMCIVTIYEKSFQTKRFCKTHTYAKY